MTPEQALQHIRAHERIASDPATLPHKRVQHEETVRYLREKYGIAEPVLVKAVAPTGPLTEDFERLHARLHGMPHVASKPDFTNTQRYSK